MEHCSDALAERFFFRTQKWNKYGNAPTRTKQWPKSTSCPISSVATTASGTIQYWAASHPPSVNGKQQQKHLSCVRKYLTTTPSYSRGVKDCGQNLWSKLICPFRQSLFTHPIGIRLAAPPFPLPGFCTRSARGIYLVPVFKQLPLPEQASI